MLASCEIEGASDASIRDAQPNDLARIFDAADIRAVFATGTKAGELYRKLIEPTLGVPCTTLPSTSPANAKMKLADLVDAYGKALLPLLSEPEKHVLPIADVVKLEKEIAKLEAKKAKADQKAAEEAKKAEAEDVLKKLLASGMSVDEILAKLK